MLTALGMSQLSFTHVSPLWLGRFRIRGFQQRNKENTAYTSIPQQSQHCARQKRAVLVIGQRSACHRGRGIIDTTIILAFLCNNGTSGPVTRLYWCVGSRAFIVEWECQWNKRTVRPRCLVSDVCFTPRFTAAPASSASTVESTASACANAALRQCSLTHRLHETAVAENHVRRLPSS